jgi:hypothetical protein
VGDPTADAGQRAQSLHLYLFDVISDEARRQNNLAVPSRFARGAQHPAQPRRHRRRSAGSKGGAQRGIRGHGGRRLIVLDALAAALALLGEGGTGTRCRAALQAGAVALVDRGGGRLVQ